MLPSTLPLTMRRGLLALCTVLCLFAFAAPASAGPLCMSGSEPADDWVDDEDGICRNFFAGGGDNAKYFLFDEGTGFEHLLRITVNTVLQDFGLRVLRNFVDPGPIPGFPDYNCVAYGFGNMCVEYTTVHPDDPGLEYHPELGVDYLGPVVWLVAWEQVVGIDPIPEIFHDEGSDPEEDVYDEILTGLFFDATLGPDDFQCDDPDFVNPEGPSFPNVCEGGIDLESEYSYKAYGDPVRGSLSNSFSRVQVGQLAAPEPATTALFAMIGAGFAVRLRRRR